MSTRSRRGFLSIFGQRESTPVENEAPSATTPIVTSQAPTSLPIDDEPPPPWAKRMRIEKPDSLARVLSFMCMGSSFCTTCVEHCPTPGAITSGQRIPVVDPLLCTGCGACEEVCPGNAIQVLPRVMPSGPVGA